MDGLKHKLAMAAIVASLAVAGLGYWGMVGKGTRFVDVLAIFAGGFCAGVAFMKLLQFPRGAKGAEAPAAPPKGKG